MYDKIKYCWNVFYYILWHFNILTLKCIDNFMQKTFCKLLPIFARNKVNENIRKGLPHLFDRDIALETSCGENELYGLACLHAFYITIPLIIIGGKCEFINKYVFWGITIVLLFIAIHIANKLTYENKECKKFFAACDKKDKQWLVKWYIITFLYYIFTFFASIFGMSYLLEFILSRIFK